ncbi:hypothetical protein [Oceanobacillus iheyensis HTE831]|uniref:DUF4178 domain-containing protein n=1 Tax=Oceanobacillus iheyensis (strain DSM 14371 / CIP 107618 / JCM 11309 / KCTC 3954 / HTE831) TaxID=221109 RepID=Q8CV18_OCEIH|nr:DUF4178 domain-containing protein [Oceanobacillus iheyensis]BAC12895.1 hypothetical protein [Oceanobacillus iheyensis HTE831]
MGLFSKLFSKNKKSEPAPKERDVFTIKVGDIVTYDLVDYEVVGKITYRSGNYEWYSYQLLEGKNTVWLAAEMDDELELGIYNKITFPVSKPFPKELSHEGKTYYFDESGMARIIGEGRSANLQGSEVEYAEYVDEDEEGSISLEVWGSEVEVSVGYPIESYEIKIMAGSL